MFSPQEVALLSQDNYYSPVENQPLDHNGIINFDTLESIDFKRFYSDLSSLKSGQIIELNEYTFNNPLINPKTIKIKPAKAILVEGIYALAHPSIRKETDVIIFIEADETKRLQRRIKRDQKERGYDQEDVIYRMENHVRPAYEKWLIPLKGDAHYVIENNSESSDAEGKLYEIIKTYLGF